MGLTHKQEVRNERMMERLERKGRMCLTNERFKELVEMTLDDMKECGEIYFDLLSKMSEEKPDYNAIIATINGVLNCIDTLVPLEFDLHLNGDEMNLIYYEFEYLREAIYSNQTWKFEKLLDEIDNDLTNAWDGEIPIKYRTESVPKINLEHCCMIVFPEHINDPVEMVRQIFKQSDFSAMIRQADSKYVTYPLTDADTCPVLDKCFEVYTVVLVEFWAKVNDIKALQDIFSEALIVDERYVKSYYNRYFLFRSNFRALINYSDVVSRH